jgi:hypothetical protein
MTERTESERTRDRISQDFREFRDNHCTFEQLEARLAQLQPSIRKMRMPEQNFFSGYITAWLAAVGKEES